MDCRCLPARSTVPLTIPAGPPASPLGFSYEPRRPPLAAGLESGHVEADCGAGAVAAWERSGAVAPRAGAPGNSAPPRPCRLSRLLGRVRADHTQGPHGFATTDVRTGRPRSDAVPMRTECIGTYAPPPTAPAPDGRALGEMARDAEGAAFDQPCSMCSQRALSGRQTLTHWPPPRAPQSSTPDSLSGRGSILPVRAVPSHWGRSLRGLQQERCGREALRSARALCEVPPLRLRISQATPAAPSLSQRAW